MVVLKERNLCRVFGFAFCKNQGWPTLPRRNKAYSKSKPSNIWSWVLVSLIGIWVVCVWKSEEFEGSQKYWHLLLIIICSTCKLKVTTPNQLKKMKLLVFFYLYEQDRGQEKEFWRLGNQSKIYSKFI